MRDMDENRVLECYHKYRDTVFKLAYSYCKNHGQAEDIFQEVFYKFMVHTPKFKTVEHEKAWFIRTTINASKDVLKTKWNKDIVRLEDWDRVDEEADGWGDVFDELRGAILALPEKYRVPIHLYYYEEYSVREIARLLHRTESAIQTQLQRGREKIKQIMEGSDRNDIESRYLRRSHGEC
ncbi:MAG: sigma-70 family RNA polymerase sigma factor [Lachnospiraceae bacterium]|jgi:RNA polymerase sigma-70 factor (ECF subfamily)|nr:sigma-70 family RNA polymerase sigma factor [Lachnospiraceae bacterium]